MGQCKSLRKFKDLFLDLLEFCKAKMKKKTRKKKTIKAWDQKVPKATKPSSQQNGANYPCCKTIRSVIKQTLLMNSMQYVECEELHMFCKIPHFVCKKCHLSWM